MLDFTWVIKEIAARLNTQVVYKRISWNPKRSWIKELSGAGRWSNEETSIIRIAPGSERAEKENILDISSLLKGKYGLGITVKIYAGSYKVIECFTVSLGPVIIVEHK